MNSDAEPPSTTRTVRIQGRCAKEVAISSLSVEVEEGPDRGQTAILSSTSFRIGSSSSNDLVLSDPKVSRHHVMLTVTSQGVRLEDLDSKNGTWVGGNRIGVLFLHQDTLIEMGSSRLRVRPSRRRFTVFPEEEESLLDLIGRSMAMRDTFALVRQLARTDLPVCITGETGTGKDLIARALHRLGPRRDQRFLVLDCGSVVADLLRSEIFGHEKGAFTGAELSRPGMLEEASGGTLLLDEVGELDLALQPNLLRALETREVSRMGSTRGIPVDVRIVSATNRDLAEMVNAKRFRSDLYFRLSCVTIRVPPLRDRRDDIVLLASHFASGYASRLKIPSPTFSDEALALLVAHPWPGNIRELKNVIEGACALDPERAVPVERVERLLEESARITFPAGTGHQARSLEDVEKQAILEALSAAGWNRKQAARKLGISYATIFNKIRLFNLKPPHSRRASDRSVE